MSSLQYFEGTETYLIDWYNELKSTFSKYKEPILDVPTVELIKWACDNLKQDSHVFTMSVNILELYINIKNYRNKKIEDQLLVICTVILICNKHIGDNADLKLKYIELLYQRISKNKITALQIKHTEIDILKTIDQKLPLHNKTDELKIFLEIYVKPMKLNVDIVHLCVQILDVVYIYYKTLFFKLKAVYVHNSSTAESFMHIITNKLYLPSGILLCAIQLTKLQNFINTVSITADLSSISNIHVNHLKLLSQLIHQIIDNSISK